MCALFCKLDCFTIKRFLSQCSEKLQLTKRVSKFTQKSFITLTTGQCYSPFFQLLALPTNIIQAGKDFQRQTLKLIFKIRKLQTKSFIRLGQEDKKTFFAIVLHIAIMITVQMQECTFLIFFQSADNQSIERHILNANAGK